ncbi:uroporphyrinogen-III synthase [Nitratireductor mangrovi]|uniref:Uroporphyrinogen-III synthase n=1 Tax=Nitratireductor mangrovi TaxID=2599600 RepID=A0A5B8L1D2_9HYPH|nr:uroporphyrinogen-III synthase [Nitratireductor mangrovi]QDZ01755.2 uroporphyrinogen-III synthase [Nitratireductor mangrovi]
MARVLVTRPEPGATATARRLREEGHEPLLLPLSETRPLEGAFPDPDGIGAVAATSVNALRHASERDLSPFLAKTFFAVGEKTAQAAREAGFREVIVGQGDGAALARLVADTPVAAGKLLYLCGSVRHGAFEDGLAGQGIPVLPVETYAITYRSPSASELARVAGAGPPDFALVYSARGAEALRAIVEHRENTALFRGTAFLCLSKAVADRLASGHRPVLVSPEPSEEALLSQLPRC